MFLGADEFLLTDQSVFGLAWRYELVRGTIVAHAVPSPEHGAILSNLAREIGSGAVPQYERRDTARILDATIRCGQLPRVLFEVISPSELSHKRQWDQKRSDLQAVEGVQEIIEIFQDEMLARAYRKQEAGWVFESISGADAVVKLPSVGIEVPLAALYERAMPEGD
jgi:Uma2 family endonuclease